VLASSSHSVKLPTTTTPASDIATKSERLEQTRAPMTATMPKQLSLISHCPLCQPRAFSAARASGHSNAMPPQSLYGKWHMCHACTDTPI
jgi:hypothetical protein